MILAPLLRHLVQDDPGTGSEVQALDHAEHRNADTHFTALDGSFTNPKGLAAEPYSELVVDGVVSLVEENAGLPLHVRRSHDRLEVLAFEIVETFVGAVESLHERPLHR